MAKQVITEDDRTRDILSRLRSLGNNKNNSSLLKEETSDNKLDAIAITNDPKFGNMALQNQIDQFRSLVDSGAQFSNPENGKVAESPLIYMPSNGNLIFSGTIPSLNNLKFQFVLRTSSGNGCFIWSDGLILSKENLQVLQKIQGYYENWRETWFQEYRDLESLKNLNND